MTRAINDPAARVYAWGTRWGPEQNSIDHIFHFTPGNGIHDIHMNQGNLDEHRHDNGTWADGAIMFSTGNGAQWCAVFLAFQTQSWETDEQGDPLSMPRPRRRRSQPSHHRRDATSSPVQWAANAHMSAISSMALSSGFPAPWPARVSMRTR